MAKNCNCREQNKDIATRFLLAVIDIFSDNENLQKASRGVSKMLLFSLFFGLAPSLFAREGNGGLVKRQDNRFSSYECGFESRSRHLNMIISVKKEFSILLRRMVIS